MTYLYLYAIAICLSSTNKIAIMRMDHWLGMGMGTGRYSSYDSQMNPETLPKVWPTSSSRDRSP
jgi:hypothetical protein